MRLTLEELAREAQTEPGRIRRLAQAGIIRVGDDGHYGPGDIHRSRIIEAFEAVGISIDDVGRAVQQRIANFDDLELFYPEPAHRSERSYGAFGASLGARSRLLGPVHAAFGLAEPDDDRSLSDRDETALEAFLDAWDLGSDEAVTRAARIMGEAIHRAVEGWVDLFTEQVSAPLQRRSIDEGVPFDELLPGIISPASRVTAVAPVVMRWLLERHLEQVLHARNMAAAEERFTSQGIGPSRSPGPPAIAFADLSGFTRLTQTSGDQEAARIAVRLGELADATARDHGGRLVKLLGDGALLRFPSPAAAVAGALELVDRARDAALPPVYIGVHTGPLIVRDGDVYGHTVNVASRVAGAAGPGEVVITQDVLDRLDDPASLVIDDLGPRELKGLAEALRLIRVGRPSGVPTSA